MSSEQKSAHARCLLLAVGIWGALCSCPSPVFASEPCSSIQATRNNSNIPESVAREKRESIVRLNSAIHEPRIQIRIPGIGCSFEVNTVAKDYSWTGFVDRTSGTYRLGEVVSVRLFQGDPTKELLGNERTLVEESWSTSFPASVPYGSKSSSILPAKISGEDLLVKLFQLNVLSQEDLVNLAQSQIPEVRIGAALNLTDEVLLTKLSINDKNAEVRKAAIKSLADRTRRVVAQLEKEVLSRSGQLDQSTLGQIAIEGSELKVRNAAVEQLTDQALLAQLALRSSEWFIRLAAVWKLTDQTVLAKIAAADTEDRVRKAAAEKLASYQKPQN